jgi:hypothetical protein
VNGPRCRAVTKAGKPCQALAGAEGLCTAHAGKTDMRELGRRGGKGRRGGLAKQLPAAERESLREALRAGLDHELVVATANEVLSGQNQSARANMIRFLADLELYRKEGDDCPRCAQVKAEAPAVREKLKQLIESRAARAVEAHRDEELKTLEPVIQYVAEQYAASGGVVPFDVSTEEAEAIFEQLEEVGLLRRRSPEEQTLVEERVALERERAELKAQRAEFAST